MRHLLMTIASVLLLSSFAQAQELLIAQTAAPRLEWSYQTAPSSCTTPTPSAIVQTRANQTSATYTVVATVPIPTPPPALATFPLPATANNLYYSVRNACGTSNEIQYVASTPPPTSPTLEQRVTTVETSLAALRLAVQDISAANMNQDTLLIEAVRRIEALEAETVPVPPPAPTSNFTITHIDATHIRIVCNGVGITTSGSGTSRTMECRQ